MMMDGCMFGADLSSFNPSISSSAQEFLAMPAVGRSEEAVRALQTASSCSSDGHFTFNEQLLTVNLPYLHASLPFDGIMQSLHNRTGFVSYHRRSSFHHPLRAVSLREIQSQFGHSGDE